jgi:hypothetical protein
MEAASDRFTDALRLLIAARDNERTGLEPLQRLASAYRERASALLGLALQGQRVR